MRASRNSTIITQRMDLPLAIYLLICCQLLSWCTCTQISQTHTHQNNSYSSSIHQSEISVMNSNIVVPFCGAQCPVAGASFCMGVENGVAYCYGSSGGCQFNSNECASDAQCSQYNSGSSKFTTNVNCPDIAQSMQNTWEWCACHGATVVPTTAPTVTATAAPTIIPIVSCPSGWTVYAGKCYLLERGLVGSWTYCKGYCATRGGHMLCIENEDQKQFITSHTNANTNRYWLGLDDQTVEGTIELVSGCTSTYTNWDGGVIDNDIASNCASADTVTGTWAMDDCNAAVVSCACEVDSMVTTPICAVGWVVGPDGECYLFQQTSVSRQSCADTCSSQGAGMLCIKDLSHNDFIWHETQGRTTWLGMIRGAGGWVWPTGCSSTYLHWHSGEPQERIGEIYSVMYKDLGGQWADADANFYIDEATPVTCACQTGVSWRPLTASEVTSTIGLDITALNSPVDIDLSLYVSIPTPSTKVLVLANLDLKMEDPTSATEVYLRRNGVLRMFGATAFHSFDKAPGYTMLANIMMLDTFGAIREFEYTMEVSGSTTLGYNAFRQLVTVVIPDYYKTYSATAINPTTLAVNSAVWATWGIDVTVPITVPDCRVLLLVQASAFGDNGAAAYATIFRDTSNMGDANVGMLPFLGSGTGHAAAATMVHLDSPPLGTYTYSARAKVVGTRGISVSAIGELRQTVAIVLPPGLASRTLAVDEINIAVNAWTTVTIDVVVTPNHVTDKFLLLVNANIDPRVSAGMTAAATIFRGSTNLGHADYGLHSIRTDDWSPITMTFLDAPATTSSITYSVKMRGVVGNFYVSPSGSIRELIVVKIDEEFGQPSSLPSSQPSGHPTTQPTSQPSSQPTLEPSNYYPQVCPAGWTAGADKCYLLDAVDATWATCETRCTSKSAKMVCLQSIAEQRLIEAHHPTVSGQYWLGLNDRASEGNFVWQGGCSTSFLNWAANQPDNVGNQDCAVTFFDQWVDNDCNTQRGCACEIPHVANAQTCPVGWVVSATGECYHMDVLETDPMSWTACHSKCSSFGAEMLCVRDAAEHSFIWDQRAERQTWTGLHKVDNQWVWSEGCDSTFNLWDASANMPVNVAGNNYVIMGEDSGLWHNVPDQSENIYCACQSGAPWLPWYGVQDTDTSKVYVNGNSYESIGLDVVASTTSASDRILLTANLNIIPIHGSEARFTIFRNGFNLVSDNLHMITPKASNEYHDVSFTFLDSPGEIGEFEYSLRTVGVVNVSPQGTPRQLAAIVLPSYYTSAVTAANDNIDLTVPDVWVSLEIPCQVTTKRATDKVLLLLTVNYQSATVGWGAFNIERSGVSLGDSTYGLQTVDTNVVGYEQTAVSVLYLDTPGSPATFSYSVVAKTGTANTVVVCDQLQTRQLSAIVLSAAQAKRTSSSALMVFPAAVTGWTSVGVDVEISPTKVTDRVLVTLNINVQTSLSTAVVDVTIFRGSVNLGDSTFGLQMVRRRGYRPASIVFLDSPGVAGIGVMYSARVRSNALFNVSASSMPRQLSVHLVSDTFGAPTSLPSSQPSTQPSQQPSSQPSHQPSTSPTNAYISSCPAGWMMYSDKCYLMSLPDSTWQQCSAACVGEHARMLCVESAEENAFLRDKHPSLSAEVWLGYNHLNGALEWPAGCHSTYTQWNYDNSEPTMAQGEACVQQWLVLSGDWGDAQCSNVAACACEKDHPPANEYVCPVGWTVAEDGGCFHFANTFVTRDECADSCEALGADMLCIKNEHDRNFLRDLRGERSTWIGLHKLSGAWEWQSGCASSYVDWAIHQPNSNSQNVYALMDPLEAMDFNSQTADFGGNCGCQLRAPWKPLDAVDATATTPVDLDNSFKAVGLEVMASTTSADDKVLLLTNMNYYATLSASMATFTFVRDEASLALVAMMKLESSYSTEAKDASMTLLDRPGAVGVYHYSVQVAGDGHPGSGVVSQSNVPRQLIAITIPSYYSSNSSSASSPLTVTATDWTCIGIETTVTTSHASDRVLLTLHANIRFNAEVIAYVTIFRGATNIGHDDVGLQRVHGVNLHTIRELANIVFVDAPGAVGSVVYSVQVKCSGSGVAFFISTTSTMRQLAAVVLPTNQVAFSTLTTSFNPSSTSWGIAALLVNMRTVDADSRVLVTATLNVNFASSDQIVYVTIFRSGANLGHATYGLQTIYPGQSTTYRAVTLSFLDEPKVAVGMLLVYTVRLAVSTGSVTVSADNIPRQVAAILISESFGQPTSMPSSQPTLSPTEKSASSCLPGWTVSADRCYLLEAQSRSYSSCNTLCMYRGANMLCLENSLERDFVIQHHPTYSGAVYIGLNDIVSEGNYLWDTQTCTSHYRNWASSEPDDVDSTQDCVVVNENTGLMADVHCTDTYGCGCQTPHVVSAVTCPVGWVVAANGGCYFFLTKTTPTWNQCQSTCAAQGASMLCIEDASQNALLFKHGMGHKTWLGLHKTTNTAFSWEAGCPSTYFNWWAANSEPNNDGAAYGVMDANSGGQWFDDDATAADTYCACQTEPPWLPWQGKSAVKTDILTVSSGGAYVSIDMNVTATTVTPTQKVLFTMNVQFRQAVTGDALKFALFRNDLMLSTPLQYVTTEVAGTSLSATMTYLAEPAAVGDHHYSLRAMGSGQVSNANSIRQIAAITIPDYFSSSVAASSDSTDITSSAYAPVSLQVSVTTRRLSDKVLLLSTLNFQSAAVTTCFFSIFRNDVSIAKQYSGLQQIDSATPNLNDRPVTMIVADAPGVVGSITYAVKARTLGSEAVTLSSGGLTRQLAAIVVPAEQTNGSVVTGNLQLEDCEWTSLQMDVSIVPLSSTDQVLVTVNINYENRETNTVALFAIFRDDVNLGGLQSIRQIEPSMHHMATMTYLDTPGLVGVPVVYSVRAQVLQTIGFSATSEDRQMHLFLVSESIMQPTSLPSQQPTSQPSKQPVARPTSQPSTQPSTQPILMPTAEPSAQPSGHPSSQPSTQPSTQPACVPTMQPTSQPSGQPSNHPSEQPSSQPSVQPSLQPSGQPTQQPVLYPSGQPSLQPTTQPSGQPSGQPSAKPSQQPSVQPSSQPSMQPFLHPSTQPSAQPTLQPSVLPTVQPSSGPSAQPYARPSGQPSSNPSGQPTSQPSVQPSGVPTSQPSHQPSETPSTQPSEHPSGQLSGLPSAQPSRQPSGQPVQNPTGYPTSQPSVQPSASPSTQPTTRPTQQPSGQPSVIPTVQPFARPSSQPTMHPSTQPSSVPSTQPSVVPSGQPSSAPSAQPVDAPTGHPSGSPTSQPSREPTDAPTGTPSAQPKGTPSSQPTIEPSRQPGGSPTVQPSELPTSQPSADPSTQPSLQPSGCPSAQPSCSPTAQPSVQPGASPSSAPTVQPTALPSAQPTSSPSSQPSVVPSMQPSALPTSQPTAIPSCQPSRNPTAQPTDLPTTIPSAIPTNQPSVTPSTQPSSAPSSQQFAAPSGQPSAVPTMPPTCVPSGQPTLGPTSQPSTDPSTQPSHQPAAYPTSQPSSSPSQQPRASPTSQPISWPTFAPQVKVILPAPNITSISVVANRTYVDVGVRLQGRHEALVYCGVFPFIAPQSFYALTSVNEVIRRNQRGITVGRTTTFRMTGLSAVTSYSVFCITESLDSIRMSYSTALRNHKEVTTECCKLVTVELLIANIFETKSSASAISVSFDSLPSSAVTITFTFTPMFAGSTKATVVHPAQVALSSNSASKSAMLTVVAGSGGDYQLSATLNGASAGQYAVKLLNRGVLKVLDLDTEPSVPALRGAVFSNDGSAVVVAFDSPTNKGGFNSQFSCVKLLSFVGASSASCAWVDTSNVAIYPVYKSATVDKVLSVGHAVSVLPGAVRAACNLANTTRCSRWRTAAPSFMNVTTAAAPTAPVVSISAPKSIGGCNSLLIDLTGSTGSAGRPWKSMTFTVSTSPGSDVAIQQLTTYLNNNYTFSPPKPIPNAVLEIHLAYSIQATLCNFLGACGSAVALVYVSPSQSLLPTAGILGKPVRTNRRMDPLVLNSHSFTQSCTQVVSYTNLRSDWTVREVTASGSHVPVVGLKSLSQNPAVFRLAGYSLKVNTQYEIALNVTSLVSFQSARASVLVSVSQANIIASIAGGSPKAFKVGDTVTLDASKSYDEDVLGLTGVAAGLKFAWSCVQTSPTFSATCPLALPATSDVTQETVRVVTTVAAANTQSRVTVNVFDTVRTASAFVDVSITQTENPVLGISSALSSLVNINANQNLVLLGSLKLVTACTAVWSVNDASIKLEAALTPTSKPLLPSATAHTFNLLLAGGMLPERATLQFFLTCGDAQTSITITTNGAPLPGQFLLVPTTGTELLTVFSFSATQWTDADIPLTYQFGFESATSLSNLVIVSKSEFSYCSSTLPAGAVASTSRLNTSLEVYDTLGAAAKAMVPVFVTQASAETQETSVLALIESSTGSVDDTKRVLSVATSVINSVNCTGAPNCTTLNRNECLTTSQSCGACSDGYIGDAGDQNTPCLPYAAVVVNVTNPISQQCLNSDECAAWQSCDQAVGLCVTKPKSCFGNCSNNGVCIFTSINLGDRLQQGQCKIDNLLCTASCSCLPGYSGRYCEISDEQLRRRRAVRSKLITSLQNLTEVDDVTTQSMSSWSASLYSLSLNPYELSVNDAANIVAIANKTLQNALRLGVESYDSIKGVLQATDTVSSVRRYNYNPNDYNSATFNTSFEYQNNTAAGIVPVLGLYSQLVTSSMVLGQKPVSYFYDNFRMTSELHAFSADGTNISVQSPQTLFEQQVNTVPFSAVLVPSAGSSATSSVVKINVITVFPRAYSPDTSSFDSDPLYLQVSSDGNAAASTLLSSMQFTLQHNNVRTVEFVRDSISYNVTSQCVRLGMGEIYTHTCPDSGHVITHNCSGRIGNFTSACPTLQSVCAKLNVQSADLTPIRTCTVLSSNSSATVCDCVFKNAASSTSRAPLSEAPVDGGVAPMFERRLTTESELLDESGVANMVATAAYVGVSFVDTFDAADNFTSADAFSQVLIVVYLFAALWGVGFFFLTACCAKSNPSLRKTMSKTLSRKVQAAKAAALGGNNDEAREVFQAYIESVIPPVYADNKSQFSRISSELCAHHRYMTLFTLSDGKITLLNKIIILLKVLTVDTMQIFLLAVLYDLQSPDDDGSCTKHSTEETCLHRQSITDSSQTYCQWRYSDQQSGYICEYAQPHSTTKTFIYIMVFTSIIVSICNIPIDYLFKICSAPLISEAQSAQVAKSSAVNTVAASAATVARNARRLSAAAGDVAVAMRRRSEAALGYIAPSVETRKSLFGIFQPKKLTIDQVIADREVSDDLMLAHSNAVALLPRLSSRAEALQRSKQEAADFVKGYAYNKRESFSRSVTNMSADSSELEDVQRHTKFEATSDVDEENTAVVRSELTVLCDEIVAQRMLLSNKTANTALYDAQWGIEKVSADRTVVDSDEGAFLGFVVSVKAREAIKGDIVTSIEAAAVLKGKLSSYTLHHAGLAVLHLFLQDILGRRTVAAKIFENKFEEDFTHTSAVSLFRKVLAFAAIIGCNAFFIYFSLLKAYQKGKSWQYDFLLACIAQMIIEIVLNETVECVWLNYFVPNLVSKEVKRATIILRNVAEELTGEDVKSARHRFFLNAPSYLFSSTKVAQDSPGLLESMVVLSYQTHLPGELSTTWPHYQETLDKERRDERRKLAQMIGLSKWKRRLLKLIFGLTTAIVLALQWLGTFSFSYQRIIIRFIQPLLFTGLTLLCFVSASSTAALCAVVIGLALVIGAYAWQLHLLHQQRLREANNIVPAALEVDAETEIDILNYEKRLAEDNASSSYGSVSRSSKSSSADGAMRKYGKSMRQALDKVPFSPPAKATDRNASMSETYSAKGSTEPRAAGDAGNDENVSVDDIPLHLPPARSTPPQQNSNSRAKLPVPLRSVLASSTSNSNSSNDNIGGVDSAGHSNQASLVDDGGSHSNSSSHRDSDGDSSQSDSAESSDEDDEFSVDFDFVEQSDPAAADRSSGDRRVTESAVEGVRPAQPASTAALNTHKVLAGTNSNVNNHPKQPTTINSYNNNDTKHARTIAPPIQTVPVDSALQTVANSIKDKFKLAFHSSGSSGDSASQSLSDSD